MKMRILFQIAFASALLASVSATAQQVPVGSGSVIEAVTRLKAGQFLWAPEVAPAGPVLVLVNVKTQRATVFRNGVPIGASTISTGKTGHETPTGVFTILQKQVEHYSSKYDNAPMPYMQRVTWGGVALHAGHLPGYPASHGCIRMPLGFARLLYGITKLGMTVVITDAATTPRVGTGPELLAASEVTATPGSVDWHPEKSPEGPVSIVVSASDHRAIVLRNGVVIGAGPVTVDGPIRGTWAYALKSVDSAGSHWIQLNLSGDKAKAETETVQPDEWKRFRAPEGFRKLVSQVVAPGTTIVVTADSLKQGEVGTALTVLEGTSESGARR
jgi:hypothetical protein